MRPRACTLVISIITRPTPDTGVLAHRRQHDAVFEFEIAELDRLKECAGHRAILLRRHCRSIVFDSIRDSSYGSGLGIALVAAYTELY